MGSLLVLTRPRRFALTAALAVVTAVLFAVGWYVLACAAAFALGWLLRCPHQEREPLEQLQDNFITTVSHELRTPLTSINGSLALLTAGLLERQPERAERMLRIAADNAERLARLVDDVLDVERLASGAAPLDLQRCDAQALVRQAVEAQREQAEAKQVTVRVHDGARVAFDGDPRRVQQVIEHLVSNAVKFSEPAATVEVRVEAADKDVRFSVRDHGRGIPRDKLDVIFERFRQLDVSDARPTGGAGLGLSICKSIVEAHGGLIRAASDGEGAGAELSFVLPR